MFSLDLVCIIRVERAIDAVPVDLLFVIVLTAMLVDQTDQNRSDHATLK